MPITSLYPLSAPEGHVRVPHLVAITTPGGNVKDEVIGELQSEEYSLEWLKEPIADQDIVEENMDKIIELRQRSRIGDLSFSSSGSQLKKERSKGRYISVLFIYQHLDLFKRIFQDMNGQ
jgi:hypothetical protein